MSLKITSKKICVYTDGSCLGNPGSGGYAICIVENNGKEDKVTFHGAGEKNTTNNRMEILALILVFQKTEKIHCDIEVFSDSVYVVNGFNIWLDNWQKNNWNKNKILNQDLWKQLIPYKSLNNYKISWIKAHSNNKYNDMVDQKAKDEASKYK